MDRGLQGSAVLEGGADRSRPRRRSGTGYYRRRHRCSGGHQPIKSKRGARRKAVPQEGNRGVVAEARPQGIAS